MGSQEPRLTLHRAQCGSTAGSSHNGSSLACSLQGFLVVHRSILASLHALPTQLPEHTFLHSHPIWYPNTQIPPIYQG